MSSLRIGCQTYAWHMAGNKYIGQAQHLIRVAAQAGFAGMELETLFLGELWQPARMAETLEANGIVLAALTLGGEWAHQRETEQERAAADKVMDLLAYFPAAILAMGQIPGQDRSQLSERQENLLRCVNTIAQRAHDRGIGASYHPNSSPGSVVRTAEDYAIVLSRLNAAVVGYTPDVGHIAKGGMNPIEVIKEYRALVTHVHYKDLGHDGEWAPMGHGFIDFPAITRYLRDSGYQGWIIMEDECPLAVDQPDEVVRGDGEYLKQHLLPIVSVA